MKKMVSSSLVLAVLFSVAATDLSCREISEKEMQALLDDSADQDATLDTTKNDEKSSDDAVLNEEDVEDVAGLANGFGVQGASDEDGLMSFDDAGMKELLDNPDFQAAYAEVEKMQKEDPAAFEKMMEESMQAMQEMMKNPEAMKAMMEGMPEELLAEVVADNKSEELINGASQAAAAA